jgi:hypothetical protein
MEKIIFASGDYPYFGGAATNIYGLVKWMAGMVGSEVYYYDGCEEMNILTGKSKEELE